jgi:uncharacterized protein (TIGR02996 family)
MNAATHPDYLALLRGVLAEPEDDWVRLVLADFLEGNGEQERAEFIRLQLIRASGPNEQTDWCHHDLTFPPDCRGCQMRRRERELLVAQWTCLDPLGLEFCGGGPGPHGLHLQGWWPESGGVASCFFFRRGFVHSITLTAADFLAHAGAIFSAQPVVSVALADKRTWVNDVGGHRPARHCWWYEDKWERGGRDDLPTALFGLLRGGELDTSTTEHCRWYSSEADAVADLTQALVAYGRSLAGLPPLPRA